MLIPVILFVYNRPEHTKKTVEALSKNRGASETDLFIFSDGPKNEKAVSRVLQTREFIDSVGEKYNFKSTTVFKSEDNRGLATSVILGVTKIISKYDKVIVLEDDLVTSRDFISYMNDALNYFEENDDIWSISGYNPPIEIPEEYSAETYLSYRGCSWGWGTWKNKWELVDWEVKDYNDFRRNKVLRTKFNLGGRDLAFMLDDQMNNKIDSWAIRWCYSQAKLGKYTVYPVTSRIKNVGLDGSGTHSGSSVHYVTTLNDELGKCDFSNAKLDAVILNRFSHHYMNNKQYYVEKYKRIFREFKKR